MITQLSIKNFRCFKDFQIDGLRRVNLIAGYNNSGKTAFLEALLLYINKGTLPIVLELLKLRGIPNPENKQYILENLASFFHGREAVYNSADHLISIKSNLWDETSLKIHYARYIDEVTYDKSTNSRTIKRRYVNEKESSFGKEIQKNVLFSFGNMAESEFINDSESVAISDNEFETKFEEFLINFIPARFSVDYDNPVKWDNISLFSEKQEIILSGLRIIEPKIRAFSFISPMPQSQRLPFVTLNDSNKIIPLTSMGDGINRILTILLALVNAENGFLLIDEFENGLHYRTMEKVWEIVFKFAKELNVQVFATTHSSDAIHSFSNVLNKQEDKNEGVYFRLSNKSGEIKPVFYDAEDLAVVTEQSIEAR